MEAVMFMADVVCMIVLALAAAKAARSTGVQNLGLFAYKEAVGDMNTPSPNAMKSDARTNGSGSDA